MFSFNAKIFLAYSALYGFKFRGLITAFNLYLLELGFKDDFVAFTFSLNTFAMGFAAFPAGLLCEKIGTKRSLIMGTLFSNLLNLIRFSRFILPSFIRKPRW